MVIKIIGLIFGIIILCFGIYYFVKEKQDVESRKIYSITSVIGGIIAVVSALLLVI